MRNFLALRFLKPVTFVRIFGPNLASVSIILPVPFTYALPLISTHFFVSCLVLAGIPKEHVTCELKESPDKSAWFGYPIIPALLAARRHVIHDIFYPLLPFAVFIFIPLN